MANLTLYHAYYSTGFVSPEGDCLFDRRVYKLKGESRSKVSYFLMSGWILQVLKKQAFYLTDS